MQAHPHSAEVQRRGCFRLQQLADIADHRAPIVQSGGDIAVLAALMTFGDDSIQRMGMCVLETLALAPTARAAMAAHIDEACSRRPPPRGDLEEDQEEQEELEADLLRRSFGSDVSEPGDRPSPPVSIDKHSRRSGAWREEQDEESAVGSGGFAVAEQRRAMWGRTDLHVGSAASWGTR